MPTIDRPFRPNAFGRVCTPIVGNTANAGYCRQRGANQALWCALVDGEWRMYVTTDGFRSLVTRDGSVEYLSTVLADPNGPILGNALEDVNAICTLTYIDGVLYANVTGHVRHNGYAFTYCRIMRDTSAAGDGSGPWVTHGRLPTDGDWSTKYPNQEGIFDGGGLGGAEIVRDGNVWATTYPHWAQFDEGGSLSIFAPEAGIAVSLDAGQSWSSRVVHGGIRAYTNSRQIARWGGKWHVGFRGNVQDGLHWTSSDLNTWTSIGSLERLNSEGITFPIADVDPETGEQRLWVIDHRIGDLGPNGEGGNYWYHRLAWTQDDPVQAVRGGPPHWNSSYGLRFGWSGGSGDPDPLLIDLDPENPDRPLWTAGGTEGKVVRLNPVDLPVVRQYPRDDGRGHSSASRVWPPPKGRTRVIGGHD